MNGQSPCTTANIGLEDGSYFIGSCGESASRPGTPFNSLDDVAHQDDLDIAVVPDSGNDLLSAKELEK